MINKDLKIDSCCRKVEVRNIGDKWSVYNCWTTDRSIDVTFSLQFIVGYL